MATTIDTTEQQASTRIPADTLRRIICNHPGFEFLTPEKQNLVETGNYAQLAWLYDLVALLCKRNLVRQHLMFPTFKGELPRPLCEMSVEELDHLMGQCHQRANDPAYTSFAVQRMLDEENARREANKPVYKVKLAPRQRVAKQINPEALARHTASAQKSIVRTAVPSGKSKKLSGKKAGKK